MKSKDYFLATYRPLLLGMVVLLSLSGCATLSKQECQVANWQAIGYRDGSSGKGMGYIQEHAKACAKVNIRPNMAQWENGRQAGLKVYCTESNAYRLGTNNHVLNNICPPTHLPYLQKANEKGLRVYALTHKIQDNKKERERLQERSRRLQAGENLEFATEKEARAYLVTLPEKIDKLTQLINEQEKELEWLRGW